MKKVPLLKASLSICLFFIFHMAIGQTKTVTGRVTDSAQNGLANVTVKIKKQPGGTTTDASGNYSITVPASTLFLCLIMLECCHRKSTVGDQSTINITLMPNNTSSTLNEVVVIGYGTVRKSDLTGAVATVKSDKLMDAPAANVSQALQGKVAGVDVSINSNAPGAAAKVRVRGIGSINSNIDPLYVVDGVIGVDGNSINPNDIASVGSAERCFFNRNLWCTWR